MLERDLASHVIIQEAECLQDHVLWVPGQDCVGDHLEGHFQASGAAAIVVDIWNQLLILERDLASLVIIQEAECLQDLVLWVPVQDFVGDHLEELLTANGAAASSSTS